MKLFLTSSRLHLFYETLQLELRSKEDSQLVQRIIEALSGGGGSGGGKGGVGLPEELETELTPEVLARVEVQLIKAVMANGQLKVSVCVCNNKPFSFIS